MGSVIALVRKLGVSPSAFFAAFLDYFVYRFELRVCEYPKMGGMVHGFEELVYFELFPIGGQSSLLLALERVV